MSLINEGVAKLDESAVHHDHVEFEVKNKTTVYAKLPRETQVVSCQEVVLVEQTLVCQTAGLRASCSRVQP